MRITDISPIGEQIIKNKGAIIIGVSLDNSYFSNEQNLENLIVWASHTAGPIYIMIPDEPAIHTKMAKGYSKEKAISESRRKAKKLQEKCIHVATKQAVPLTIILWGNIAEKLSYRMSLIKMRTLYEADTIFNQMVRLATKDVLMKDSSEVSEENIDLGINFLFQELAFITNANQILGESLTAYVYHKTMPVLQYVLDRHTLLQNDEVGCITLVNER